MSSLCTRSHWWTSEDFDGDTFVVDWVRREAARSVKRTAEEPLRSFAMLSEWSRDEDVVLGRQLRDKLAVVKTVDDEWLACWQLWELKKLTNRWWCDAEGRKKKLIVSARAGKPET